MSILSKDEILKEIKKGNIKVTPFNAKMVGPASIDLTLGDKFRVFKKSKKIHDINANPDYKSITTLVKTNSILIKPQETLLAVTKEKITLSSGICGWLEGRSSYARLGLMIHISAPFMQPGINNHPVLEISNMGCVTMRLHAGTSICQFVFQEMKGKSKYSGKFKDQDEP